RERRAAIIEVARRHDLQILEDECYAPSPGPDAPPSLRALAPERVWFAASLSKIIAAGLRFGMLLCPEGMGRAGRVAAQHSHMGLSQPITGLVTRLLESGDAERIATKVQAQVADRLALAHDCLSPLAAISRPGVPMLWLPLPSPWRAEAFVLRAASAGVFVRPASDFHAAPRMQSTPVEAVRIALNCRLPRDRLAEGLRLVAQLALSDPTQGPA
ncbi:MAG: PLP-dependent aminotransferase family protein, partial [Paracoccus sp. (in: a-proteobacteria)]|nr:PLP-dependent aminotransferase family protein [Paracoccus sp. (in: a-proteobacteria)]